MSDSKWWLTTFTATCAPEQIPAMSTQSAAIKDDTGKVIFEQTNCLVPEGWSQLATNVVFSKYAYGDVKNGSDPRTDGRETVLWAADPATAEPSGIVGRVVNWLITAILVNMNAQTASAVTEQETAFITDTLAKRLANLLLNQRAAFNSPVWFNAGLHSTYGIEQDALAYRWHNTAQTVVKLAPGEGYQYPQVSACFIQSVGDDMESIGQRALNEMMLFKFGSGTGTDNSTIRSCRESLSGGGKPSGPVTFMGVYDAIAGVVKSGGKTRRAAKMETLKIDHPDIREFIQCKRQEEDKARALIRQGYDASFNGEAYASVKFQNANLSVRLSDAFMRAVAAGADWQTNAVTTGQPISSNGQLMPSYPANTLLDAIATGTWLCGDPGVQYEDTIQKWHTCADTTRINSSNPCCFVAETLVRTTEGLIAIGDLAARAARNEPLPSAFGYDRILQQYVVKPIKHAWLAGHATKLTRVKTESGLEFI